MSEMTEISSEEADENQGQYPWLDMIDRPVCIWAKAPTSPPSNPDATNQPKRKGINSLCPDKKSPLFLFQQKRWTWGAQISEHFILQLDVK